MNILVVGCRRVGANLVRALDLAGHEVSVLAEAQVDLDQLNHFNRYDFTGMRFVGPPVDIEVLRSAGIESVDAVACVAQDDNVNLMAAQIAAQMFKVPKVLCRVANPETKEVFSREFGLHVLCPTNLTVAAAVEFLVEEGETSALGFGRSTAGFVYLPVPAAWAGRPLLDVPPQPGRLLFGVLHKNQLLELANTPALTLCAEDQIVYAELLD